MKTLTGLFNGAEPGSCQNSAGGSGPRPRPRADLTPESPPAHVGSVTGGSLSHSVRFGRLGALFVAPFLPSSSLWRFLSQFYIWSVMVLSCGAQSFLLLWRFLSQFHIWSSIVLSCGAQSLVLTPLTVPVTIPHLERRGVILWRPVSRPYPSGGSCHNFQTRGTLVFVPKGGRGCLMSPSCLGLRAII